MRKLRTLRICCDCVANLLRHSSASPLLPWNFMMKTRMTRDVHVRVMSLATVSMMMALVLITEVMTSKERITATKRMRFKSKGIIL